jgi:hypothetical protein
MRSVAVILTCLLVAAAVAVAWMHGLPGLSAHMNAVSGTRDSAPAASQAQAAAAPTKDAEGWPVTRAGELGRRWVTAFNTGEKEMKECLADIMASESLKKTAMPQRVERYKDLREKFGTLTLVSIDSSEPYKVSATLAATDLSQHHFVFNTQTAAPFKLLSVSMMEPHFGLHGFGH